MSRLINETPTQHSPDVSIGEPHPALKPNTDYTLTLSTVESGPSFLTILLRALSQWNC
jgi:hypothetical protein